MAEDYLDLSTEELIRRSDLGDANALFLLGKRLHQEGDPRFESICKAAGKRGVTKAYFFLGRKYLYGHKVGEDGKKAFRYFSKAAEQGYLKGYLGLAECYRYGKGVPQDDEKAIGCLKEAANQGLLEAIRELGRWYRDGICTKPRLGRAVECLRKGVERGDMECLAELAWAYEAMGDIEGAGFAAYTGARKGNDHCGDALVLLCCRHVDEDLWEKDNAARLLKDLSSVDRPHFYVLLYALHAYGFGEDNQKRALRWLKAARKHVPDDECLQAMEICAALSEEAAEEEKILRLYGYVDKDNPFLLIAEERLGDYSRNRGDFDKAGEHYRKAIAKGSKRAKRKLEEIGG